MKTKNYIILLLIFFFSLFDLQPLNSQSQRMKDQFYIGFVNDGGGYFYNPNTTYQLNMYKELSLNMNHSYGVGQLDDQYNTYVQQNIGYFYTPLSTYASNVDSRISRSFNNGQKVYLARIKTFLPAYGQRSDYQAEYTSTDLTNWSIRPGYGFKTTNGTLYSETFNGESVYGRRMEVIPTQDGNGIYIVQDLHENIEQVNVSPSLPINNNTLFIADRKKTGYKWFVKPRMRIAPITVNTTNSELEKDVVTIEMYNFDGNIISGRTVTLKVKNFKDTNGVYNGEYKEIFVDDNLNILNIFVTAEELFCGRDPDHLDSSLVDYRIKWHGEVNVWLDYVRLDDEWAHFLFEPHLESTPKEYDFITKIEEEVTEFANEDGFGYFNMDEFIYNNIPCIKRVQEIIKSINPNTSLIPVICDQCITGGTGLRNYTRGNDIVSELKNRGILNDIIMTDIYPFWLSNTANAPLNVQLPPNLTPLNSQSLPSNVFYHQANTNSEYADNVATKIEHKFYINEDENVFASPMQEYRNAGYILKNQLDAGKDAVYCNIIQLHNWFEPFHTGRGIGLREPTNEEIRLQAYLSMAYGAQQIMYFTFPTYANGSYIDYGMMASHTLPSSERINNEYGQKKWDSLVILNQKLCTLGNRMYPPGQRDKHLQYKGSRTVNTYPDFESFYYPNNIGPSRGLPFEYITDIRSIVRDPSTNQLTDNPAINDPDNKRYWEIGLFGLKTSHPDYLIDKSKYVMFVNKRCTPEIANNDGDVRGLMAKFDSGSLTGFNNWVVIDVLLGNQITTFNKNVNAYVNLGRFEPGEGRLFKIAPVMHEGGTFVTDEEFGNTTFTCKEAVNTDGYNLTIGQGTNINFLEPAKIVMEGGEFECGYASIGSPSVEDVNLKGKAGVNWEGLEFNNCALVKMINTNIDKIENNFTSSNSAITAVDCPVVLINKSSFDIQNTGQNYSAVDISFVTEFSEEVEPSIDLMGNIFEVVGTKEPQVKIMNYSFNQAPVYIRWNNFVGDQISNGILLDNVTGGVISKNIFTDFEYSITGVATYIDIFNNTNNNVTSSSTNSTLSLYAGTYVNMTKAFGTYMAGYNTFNNYGSGSNNILTDNAYFNINLGYNVFNVSDGNMHFSGSFYDPYSGGRDEFATENCFKIDGDGSNALHDVIWEVSQDPVSFIFEAYNCDTPPIWDYTPITVTQYIEDTLWFDFGGGLGGGSSNKKNQSKIITTSSFKDREDSLKLNLRKRNLNDVKRIGNEILDNYADSIRSMDVIQPLYYATMRNNDTSNSEISTLKIKLENLIANHSNNASLVLRCNYFIQKCKVILGQYQSALTGFNDIMQNYPYSWEGVVAGWDYAATQLISQGGSGGGESSVLAHRAELSYEPNGDDPKGVKKTVENTLSETKEKAINQIKIEEQQIRELRSETKTIKEAQHTKDIKHTKSLEKKLQQKKIMQEVIKPRKPETVIEHIQFVNSDIQKIYSISNKTTDIEDNISIPDKYSLSQNYPNPFNPVTKIKFELPKESKVTIVIYDILGRKVAQLINNELRQAGRYEVQFNGQNFASGIYFYRLVANDFIDTKRMVLVK